MKHGCTAGREERSTAKAVLSGHPLVNSEVLSDSPGPARLRGMKTKSASGDTRPLTLAELNEEFAAIDRDRNESSRWLDAIGAANKWLRTSMSKATGRFVGERDVALLVGPVFDSPGPGREWVATLYTADGNPPRSEWFGRDGYTALTSAVCALVADDVLDLVQRQGGDYWFKFQSIHGEEIVP